MKQRDLKHLNILSVLHYVGGIYFVLVTLIISRYVVAGVISFIQSQGSHSTAVSSSESFTGWGEIILISGLLMGMMVMGICMILTGRYLSKQRYRIFCSVIAVLESLSFPLGTLLGVFTLVTINRDSVKELFAGSREDLMQPPLRADSLSGISSE